MRKYFFIIVLSILGLVLTSCFNETKSNYNINYYIQDEKLDLNPSKYSFKEETKLPSYTKEGSFFAGWYKNQNFEGEPLTKIAKGNNVDITLYGKLLKLYKLQLVVGFHDYDFKETFHEEEEVILPKDVTHEGYVFAGWYDNEDFEGEEVFKVPLGTKENKTFYAKLDVVTNNLILNFNGGDEVGYQKTFTSDEVVTLPNIKKKNYTFLGWYDNEEFNGKVYEEVPFGTITDLALYAKFEKDRLVTLYYNDDHYETLFVSYGSQMPLPTPKPEDYYEFDGWYLRKSGLGEPITIIDDTYKEDVTLYANYVLSESIFSDLQMPSTETIIERNINFPKKLHGFDVSVESHQPHIISDEGILKREYEKSYVTLTVKITDYKKPIFKDYTYTVKGYKSLEAPIRSGYVYRNYFLVDDYFFDNQEIIYAAFAIADSDGNFILTDNYYGRVTANLMPKAQERGVRVIMSVGPSSHWSYFAKDADARTNFVDNIIHIINLYGFDGVDIDWEVPIPAEGEHLLYTKLMKEVHTKVKQNNSHHLVTTAITGGSSQPSKYDLRNSGKYIDYINIMTYGMASSGGLYQNALYPRTTYHDQALRAGMPPRSANISESITIFNGYGIPNHKLVVGIAFYGIKQTRTYNAQNNTYGSWIKYGGGLDLSDIYLELNRSDQHYVYDEISQVPYIKNDSNTVFISYDDERSIQAKALFIVESNVAGVMYWEYGHDEDNTLLKYMVDSLPKS